MSQETPATSDVPMVPLQEDHPADEVKMIVEPETEKDKVPLGEQCMEPSCNKIAVGECAKSDCKKRLCVDHKKELNYAHDHRTLCAVHYQRAMFHYKALLGVVLVILLIGVLIWAVPNPADYCDGKPDGVYCKTLSSYVTCASGYGSQTEMNCPITNKIQSLCFQCNPTFASCQINNCPPVNSTTPTSHTYIQ